ncbi:hypothetical protein BDN67DRAFT_608988 [Paxillus ammoniavirescens]|nr:hypothetical protein BDN67DRAFT_608988 [Paxillus ammoniavirescens]
MSATSRLLASIQTLALGWNFQLYKSRSSSPRSFSLLAGTKPSANRRKKMLKTVLLSRISNPGPWGCFFFLTLRKFADRVEAEDFAMNALIANAVLVTVRYSTTQDGFETTFVPHMSLHSHCHVVICRLSTALLSILMLPHLIKTTTAENASRLVIVSSEFHDITNKLPGSWPSILGRLNDKAYCTSSVIVWPKSELY